MDTNDIYGLLSVKIDTEELNDYGRIFAYMEDLLWSNDFILFDDLNHLKQNILTTLSIPEIRVDRMLKANSIKANLLHKGK